MSHRAAMRIRLITSVFTVAISVTAISLVIIFKPTPEEVETVAESERNVINTEPVALDSGQPASDEETLSLLNSGAEAVPEYDYSELFGDKEYDDDWCNHFELTRDANKVTSDEFLRFADERGHFSGGYNNYFNYTTEDLRALGEAGDQIALYTLVNRPDIDTQTKLWAGKISAIYGGTGLVTMENSLYHEIRYHHLMAENREDEAQAALTEALAWAEFAAMRRDNIVLRVKIRWIDRMIKSGELNPKHINADATTRRAQEIYDEIEAIRIEKGLGKFDNTVPTAVARGNDWNAARMIVYGINVGWGNQYLPDNPCVQKNINELSNQIIQQD